MTRSPLRLQKGLLPEGIGPTFPDEQPQSVGPDFGEGSPSVLKYVVDVSSALSSEEIKITGDWFWIIDATALTTSMDVKFNEQVAQPITVKKGLFIAGVPFDRIFVTCSAQANSSMTIQYGRGNVDIRNPAGSLSSVSISGTAATLEVKAATIVTTADDSVAATTLETVLAANTSRREAIIKNLAANTDNIRVGDATNTGATRGHELKPGESIILTTTAAIGVYNLGAGAQSVSLVEIED